MAKASANTNIIPDRASLVLKLSPIKFKPFANIPRNKTPTSVPTTLGRPLGCIEAPMNTAAIASRR
jgi:hypothetical protein